MNAQTKNIQASAEFNVSKPYSAIHRHSDWSFLPTAAGGLTGVVIGIVLGTLLGWC